MNDSKTYARNQTRLRFHHLPKALRDEIQSAIRIAWIDGGLAQIDATQRLLAPQKPLPSTPPTPEL